MYKNKKIQNTKIHKKIQNICTKIKNTKCKNTKIQNRNIATGETSQASLNILNFITR